MSLKKTDRLFLTLVGVDNCYPNYGEGKNKLILSDSVPINGSLKEESPFLTSPIYSFEQDGEQIPELSGRWSIHFYTTANPIKLLNLLDGYRRGPKYAKTAAVLETSVWFTLGLSNVVLVEREIDSPADSVQALVKSRSDEIQTHVNALESWSVVDFCVVKNKVDVLGRLKRYELSVKFPKPLEKYPTDTQFAVSEYMISAQKILDASRKFTPQYHDDFVRIFEEAQQLVDDLLGLLANDMKLVRPKLKELVRKGFSKEQLINDKHGRLTQLNSALSYVYNQAYSGSLPILEHFGIIRRFSLLGVGGGINALFELVGQLEELFVVLNFEEVIESGDYFNEPIGFKYSPGFMDDEFDRKVFEDDYNRKRLIEKISPVEYTKVKEDDYFKRFSFYSGRLGFREYDFSATSAIQVLIDGKNLRWNVVNYTHELIHNHVRIILNKLLRTGYFDYGSDAAKSYLAYLNELRLKLVDWWVNKTGPELNYSEFFRLLILRYCVMSSYAGSLTRSFNQRFWDKAEMDQREYPLSVPEVEELGQLIIEEYKGISEIFVHILDFSYIYRKEVDTYVESIWCSWSTVGLVTNDLPQYVLRTLLVIAQAHKGNGSTRYEWSVRDLNTLFDRLKAKHPGITIFETVKRDVLSDTNAALLGIKSRFLTCLPLADMVGQFFVADVEKYLNRTSLDPNVGVVKHEPAYKMRYGAFELKGESVVSKVRFTLGQVQHTIDNLETTTFNERSAAWLLLNLSDHVEIA
ncbi:MAG: hypothetical protein H6603_03710 [Flavobacteriales bacterium]|nr:hypothetical protein [Flavobacteriales bacterium]